LQYNAFQFTAFKYQCHFTLHTVINATLMPRKTGSKIPKTHLHVIAKQVQDSSVQLPYSLLLHH